MSYAHLVIEGKRRERMPDTSTAVPELLLRAGLHREVEEVVLVLPYDADGWTDGPIEVAHGHQGHVVCPPGWIVSAALASGCDRFVIAHNHPNGNPLPSQADGWAMATLKRLADELGLHFIDSYIVNPNGHVTSCREWAHGSTIARRKIA